MPAPSAPRTVLVIDLRECWQEAALAAFVRQRQWARLPGTLGDGARAAAAALAARGARATFVADAWCLERHAALLRELAAGGHELAAPVALPVDAHRLPAWTFAPLPARPATIPEPVWAALQQQQERARRRFDAMLAASTITTLGELQPLSPLTLPAPRPAPVPAADAVPITVVVPMFDERDNVAMLLRGMDELAAALAPRHRLHLVLVDDGSTDGTGDALAQAAAGRDDVQVLRHEHNRGIAAAIGTGLRAATTELVASIDSDCSYDPLELVGMVPLCADADLVTASPYHPLGGVRNVPGWRLFLSRTLSRCYRLLLRRPLHTWTSCCRVYRRSAIAPIELHDERFLGIAELLVRACRRGLRVREHPAVLEARVFGRSKLKVLRTIAGHLGLLLRVLVGRVR